MVGYYVPPHCPHCVCVGPAAVVVDDTVVVEAGADVGADVVEATVVVVLPVPVLLPLPIEVVMGPLSMYTPDMYQFSGVAVLTIRSTPTWKSSEFVEVDAATLFITFVRGAEPFDAQRPTVLAENYQGNQCMLEHPTQQVRTSISYAKLYH